MDNTKTIHVLSRPRYLQDLANRREAAEIQRLIAYGLTLGWILTLVAGFLFFCVPSRFDWLWFGLMLLGGFHLAAAVVLPQALTWPERIWMTIARWQGHVVMCLLLSVIYFLLIWPAHYLSRRQFREFQEWDEPETGRISAWQPIKANDLDQRGSHASYRSLPVLVAGVIGFFFRRGNYVVLPILILLILLGLILFVVQNSVIAPFIYPLF